MKNNKLYLLASFIVGVSISLGSIANAALLPQTVPQGGTGWGDIQANTLLTGNGTGRLATTTIGSGLTLSGGVLTATGTGSPGGSSGQVQYNGSGSFAGVATTTLSAGTNVTFTGTPGYLIGGTNLTINATGGSGVWPYTTTDTNYGVAVQSTTTPEWFKNGMMASSTSYFSNIFVDSTSATSTIKKLRVDNLNNILTVPYDFASAGCAASSTATTFQGCVRALYESASTTSAGVQILVTHNITASQWTDGIDFDINGLAASMKCTPGVKLVYGGTGTSRAVTFNFGNPTGHWVSDNSGCIYMGNTTLIAAAQNNTKMTTGIYFGGDQGGVGINFHDNSVNGFGKNLEIASNAYMLNIQNNSISGGNGTTTSWGSLVHINTASNSGERNNFIGNNFTDPGNSVEDKAIYIADTGTASNFFSHNSFGDAQIYIEASNGQTTINNNHFENAAFGTYGEYIPVYAVSAASNSVVFNYNEIADDGSGATNFDTIIKHGVNLTAIGNHINNYGGGTITYFADHSLNNGSSSELVCATSIQGGGLTNIVRNQAYSAAAGPSCWQTYANSYPLGWLQNSNNVANLRNGNQNVATVSETGNWVFGGANGDVSVTNDLTVGLTSRFTGLSTFGAGFLSNASSTINSGLFSMNGGATTTALTVTGNSWLPALGTAAGTFLAVDSNGKIIATTTPSSGSGTFPFTPVSYGNSTSTTLGFLNGFLSTASSTFNSNTYFPSGIWNSSGNVGIGTTSPWGLLSVNPNALGSGVPSFVIGSSTATNFIVTNGGNVGIGTAAPTYKFQVVGPGTSQLNAMFENDGDQAILNFNAWGSQAWHSGSFAASRGRGTKSSPSYPLDGDNLFSMNMGGWRGTEMATDNGVRIAFQADGTWTSASTPGMVTFSVNDGTTAWNGGSQSMVFRSTGNLGIGEASPGSKLSVSGGATIGASYSTTAAPTNGLLVQGNVGIGTTTPLAKLDIAGTLGSQSDLFNISSTTATNVVSSLFRIGASGNVGIGTTSPATLLEIGGSTANVTLGGYKSCTGFTSNANGLVACTASDQRLKQDVVSLDGSSGLSAINALNPVSFYWKPETERSTQQQYGLIAQQVQSVFPSLVVTSSPTVLTPDGTLSVNYEGLISPMIRAIQELDARTNFIQNAAASTTLTDELLKLRPVTFQWKDSFNGGLKDNPNYSGVQYSLIADEVQKIDPHLVTIEVGTTTFDGKEYPAGTVHGLADSNHWTALFVKSIQEMWQKIVGIDEKVKKLETENADLKAQLDMLEARLNAAGI